MRNTLLGSSTGTQSEDTIREQLDALCAAYLASDEWGRERIVITAQRHARSNANRSARTLRLVASAGLDQ